jgi:hypothetical protein
MASRNRPEKQGNTPLQVWIANAVISVIDDITGALQVISTVHAEVHEGETYFASYKSPEGGDIGDNQKIEILLVTGAKECHLTFVIAGGGDTEVYVGENVTADDPGTALAAVNMHRNAAGVATATPTHTPTNASNGDQLENNLLPGGSGGNAGGGVARKETEWIFKPNTTYVVRGINRGGGAKPMSISLQWYEETVS